MERSSRGPANHLRSLRVRAFPQSHDNTVSLCDGLSSIANQLQNFIQDEALGFEKVAVVGAVRGYAPVSDLLMQFRERKQRRQGFLAGDGFEDAVALL